VEHRAAVAEAPVGAALHLVAEEAVLDDEHVVRVGRLVEEVPEVPVEGVPLVVDDAQHPVLDAEGVVVVDAGRKTRELGHPAGQVLAVE